LSGDAVVGADAMRCVYAVFEIRVGLIARTSSLQD